MQKALAGDHEQGIILDYAGIEGVAAKRLYLVPLIYANAFLPIVLGYWFTIRHPRRRVLSRAPTAAA